MKNVLPLAIALIAAAPVAHATEAGNWEVKFGLHAVDPKSDNGTLAGGALKTAVDSSVRPSVSLEYRVTPNLGVEVLGALPFQHEVKLNGMEAARTKDLPPAVGVNYHFLPDAAVSPFLGAGINYTHFFGTTGRGLLQGANVHIGNSWGVAAHAGLDVRLSPRWLLTGDVRWINMEPDVRVNGSKVGTAKVDPLVYGISAGYRF